MKRVVAGWFMVLGLTSCSNEILIDQVRGRTLLPRGRIANLETDRPGAVSMGFSAGLRKPSRIHLRAPTGDSLVAGRQDWELPSGTFGAQMSWTPWEGITLSPDATAGWLSGGWVGSAGIGLGLHTGLEYVDWGLVGRLGGSWTRSILVRRTRVDDPSVSPLPYLDSSRTDSRHGLSPFAEAGIQFESRIPRQPVQLWALGRWSLANSSWLSDARNEAFALSTVQAWQAGLGIHRALGGRNTLSAGVLRTVAVPGWSRRSDATTEFVAQWECRLRRPASETAGR